MNCFKNNIASTSVSHATIELLNMNKSNLLEESLRLVVYVQLNPCFSNTPIVETKYKGGQNIDSFWYLANKRVNAPPI